MNRGKKLKQMRRFINKYGVIDKEYDRPLTEFNRRPIYPVKTVIYPESRIHRYYCPVCGRQQKSKVDGCTWYCERCGEKLRMVR